MNVTPFEEEEEERWTPLIWEHFFLTHWNVEAAIHDVPQHMQLEFKQSRRSNEDI